MGGVLLSSWFPFQVGLKGADRKTTILAIDRLVLTHTDPGKTSLPPGLFIFRLRKDMFHLTLVGLDWVGDRAPWLL